MDWQKLRTIYKLKSIYRLNSQDNRKESTAEHVYSSIMLADFLLDIIDEKLDRKQILDILLYHDIVEIHAGDSPLHPGMKDTQQYERERQAADKLKNELPELVGKRVYDIYKKYRDLNTREAKFAKAIDALDPMVHGLDNKTDWIGWSEAFLREKKEKYVKEFPELYELFNNILIYMNKEGFFEQKHES